jgi:hypothetical protein
MIEEVNGICAILKTGYGNVAISGPNSSFKFS